MHEDGVLLAMIPTFSSELIQSFNPHTMYKIIGSFFSSKTSNRSGNRKKTQKGRELKGKKLGRNELIMSHFYTRSSDYTNGGNSQKNSVWHMALQLPYAPVFTEIGNNVHDDQ